MKRLSILAVFMLISVITFAQQALWGSQNIISPEIHPDNTVTFRFLAPKAIKVQVTGDFLPTQKMETQFGLVDVPGTVDLKESKVFGNILRRSLFPPNYIATLLLSTD